VVLCVKKKEPLATGLQNNPDRHDCQSRGLEALQRRDSSLLQRGAVTGLAGLGGPVTDLGAK
jgi:hypothetical protein